MDGQRYNKFYQAHFVVFFFRTLIKFKSYLLQLETISLIDIPAQFVKPILKAFGAGLKRLTFESCEKINVPDLVYCKQLEALQILGSSCLAVKKTDDNLNPESFLPLLKSFESRPCLGTWSSLFEEKSTLVCLCLNCTHIGIEVI